MPATIDTLLSRVSKPARYTGGEWNTVTKDWNATNVHIALAFPDAYDIGMSNMGLGILYDLLNKVDDIACERTFAPWGDMEQEMRNANIPLYALESGDALGGSFQPAQMRRSAAHPVWCSEQSGSSTAARARRSASSSGISRAREDILSVRS